MLLSLQSSVPACTIAALKLPSTALSEVAVKTKARQLWGDDFIIQSRIKGNLRYSIKEVGYTFMFKDYMAGFIKEPILRPVDRIIGKDLSGSYRRAWNNAMVVQCKEGKPVLP